MPRRSLTLVTPLALALLAACTPTPEPDTLSQDFTISDGLEISLWAKEPLMVNPTNFDIDERGRVWFIESVNYRSDLKSFPKNDEEGDRIVILEDTNGDGRADSRKVFDQHKDMLAPLGISVLGNKVLVSQSPDLFVYTKDENDNIINKETLLTGWGGVDHDHGLHVVLQGHDGRYYFNSGDQGFETTDKSGKQHSSCNTCPYFAATVQTVNPDGTDFRVLSHNARNPYEIAFDSFGSIFQTDNDDDGNKWTRLLAIFEGANYGYWGPGGRRWREDHGSHFHMERPGVMPFIARTGPGSPTGLVLYEGKLLPEKYWGQLLHSEPGKRLIQAFHLSPDGAGYSMEAESVATTTQPYFRPSDIAVAPDGSLLVSDWYDPVVGGHNMKDIGAGRIYRIAPVGHKWTVPEYDFETDEGIMAAFASPNNATRVHAYNEIESLGSTAQPLLAKMWNSDDAVLKARSLWLYSAMGADGQAAVEEALAHPDPNFRMLGLRVARTNGADILATVQPLLEDSNPHVRREIALQLQHVDGSGKLAPWMTLAEQYDGEDRWYLESLAIGARGQQEALYPLLRKAFPGQWNAKLADFLFVLQTKNSLPYLTQSLSSSGLGVSERLQAIRALGFRPEPEAARAVATLLLSSNPGPVHEAAFERLSQQLFSQWIELRDHPTVVAAVRRALANRDLQADAVRLAQDLGDKRYLGQLENLASSARTDAELRKQAIVALGRVGRADAVDMLTNLSAEGADELRIAALEGLGNARPQDLGDRLRPIIESNDNSNNLRNAALRVMGRTPAGLNAILDMAEADELPASVKTLATNLVNTTRDREIRERAKTILPPPESKDAAAITNWGQIVNNIGNPDKGADVFQAADGPKCATCHSLEDGKELAGPNLAAIGDKYDKRGLLDSILNPSAGIAPEYYTWILDTKTQGLLTGVLAEDTPERILLRTETGDELVIEPGEVVSRRKSQLSMMPEDLVNTMTEQELVDLLEYLTTLKDNQLAAN